MNECIRCKQEMVRFTRVDGIIHPVGLDSQDQWHCKGCGLIFWMMSFGKNKSDSYVRVYFERPKNRCKKCYGENPDEITIYGSGTCIHCGESTLWDEYESADVSREWYDGVLEGQRSWDDKWYKPIPSPSRPVNNIGYIMTMMFGFNKSYRKNRSKDDTNHYIYGEVRCLRSRMAYAGPKIKKKVIFCCPVGHKHKKGKCTSCECSLYGRARICPDCKHPMVYTRSYKQARRVYYCDKCGGK